MLPTQAILQLCCKVQDRTILNQARHYLQLAGYSPPGGNVENVVNLLGTLTNADGTVKNDTVVKLLETLDNSTYPTSLTQVAQTTTDVDGAWAFTVSPTTPGTHYYYLQDTTTNAYTYLKSYTVAATPTPTPTPTATSTPPPTTSDNTLIYVAVAIVVIIIVIAAVALFLRRKK